MNTNIARSLTGGIGLGTEIFNSAYTTGPPPVLQRAVVVDVITDPALLEPTYKQNLARVVNNPELLDVLIPNSVIAQIISNRSGTGNETLTCLFPLYPSHFQLPIAPGEQIFVIFEDIAITGPIRGYWLSRIPGYYTIEDANYTHLDRRFDPTTNINNYTTRDIDNRPETPSPETFQNGGGTPETRTINNIQDENVYNYILTYSDAGRYLTPEPVPRWKKRPQELILQGANNSLIMLGEDRNGPINGALGAGNDIEKESNITPRYAGAIDIVVGRGRYVPAINTNPRLENDNNPPGFNSTAPLIIDNQRGYFETNKNPFRARQEAIANAIEGDPDPIYDAARLYVVQQSLVDENYKLISNVDGGIIYPSGSLVNMQPEGQGPYGRSYVVAKADNIRIIARREPSLEEQFNIAGSILIIREGIENRNELTTDDITYQPEDYADTEADETTEPTEPNGSLAYMYIDQAGDIQIEARKIYLGRTLAPGENEDEFINPEPYLRYSVYKITVEALQSQIEALTKHISELEDKLANAFNTAVAVPYSNIAALQQIGTKETLTTQFSYQKLEEKVNNFGEKIRNTYNEHIKSTKIFGE